MASIQLGVIVTDIKGSIGGTTFSRNKSGLTARARSTGKRAVTTKQANQLQKNIAIINEWNKLYTIQKEVWNAYASVYTHTDRYGKVKHLTGFNWFILVNTAYFYVNGTYLLAPLPHGLPSFLPSFTVNCSSTDIIVTFSLPVDPLTTELYLFTSTPTQSNAQYNRSAYRFTPNLPVDHYTTFSIKDAWEEAHNLPWDTVNYNGQFNISVLIQPISLSSFVTGSASTGSGIVVNTGIGFMSIGSTFVVS